MGLTRLNLRVLMTGRPYTAQSGAAFVSHEHSATMDFSVYGVLLKFGTSTVADRICYFTGPLRPRRLKLSGDRNRDRAGRKRHQRIRRAGYKTDNPDHCTNDHDCNVLHVPILWFAAAANCVH